MSYSGEKKFTVTSIEPTVGPKSGGNKISRHYVSKDNELLKSKLVRNVPLHTLKRVKEYK